MSLERYSKTSLTSLGYNTFINNFVAGLRLPPKQTVSEWADKNRKLSSESSAEIGSWNTSRAEYQRGMMDAVGDINTTEVVFMTSAQIGKTEIFNNAIGYSIDKDPSPILVVQPSLEMAKAWSEDRLSPMLRDTPCLQGLVQDVKTKNSENTKLHKVFPGGHITISGANSPASLASRPIKKVFMDEIDRFPYSAGVEGDPVKLAMKRTTTFWDRKHILASTPTLKGYSKIEAAFERSDKRYFYIPCPHCKEYQRLYWKNIKWENDEPETAQYQCESCGKFWNDVERWKAVSQGHWKASKPFKGHAGFFLWEAYSPWVRLADIVRSFIDANKEGQEALKVFINTSLAETWEDQGERINETELYSRREDYNDMAPPEVAVITAGVDVQADRIEVDRYGWGENEQSWALGKKIIYGDPTGGEIWELLDEYLREPVKHALTGYMPIMATAVDTGYSTQQVGLFCLPRWGRRIWAIKGVNGQRPIWQKSPSKLKGLNLRFFIVGVDQAKETIYSRLRITDPEKPGYCHFSKLYDDTHFEQLTSEECVTQFKRGRPTRFWRLKQGHKRNEALDMFVYALAALEGLRMGGVSVRRRYKKMVKEFGEEKIAEAKMNMPNHGQESVDTSILASKPEDPRGKMVKTQARRRRRLIRR